MGKWAETEEAYFGRSDTQEEKETMKERVLPILFNTDMVQAILDGRKTVTRRIAKGIYSFSEYGGLAAKIRGKDIGPISEENVIKFKAPFQKGDTLYVREKWCNVNREGAEPEYYYYADTRLCEDYDSTEWKWRPSIHMPREATRIWLKVTDVRVERLQDITDQQAEIGRAHV